uniref:Uncharacterized protein n=1 Tax=Pararge aegeria TaxID=116150 RepID=S4PLH5_9NEOP
MRGDFCSFPRNNIEAIVYEPIEVIRTPFVIPFFICTDSSGSKRLSNNNQGLNQCTIPNWALILYDTNVTTTKVTFGDIFVQDLPYVVSMIAVSNELRLNVI